MRKALCLSVLVALLASGCGFGQGGGRGFRLTQQAAQPDTAAVPETDARLPMETALTTETPGPLTPTATLTVTPEVFPRLTFAQNANCRKGPGTGYYAVVSYTKGETAEVNGRNEDGTWLWVRTGNDRDYCWVAASAFVDLGDAGAFHQVPYQALPDAPVLLEVTRKVCGGTNILHIEWSDVRGEAGYHLYRNGELVGTFPAAVTFTLDYPRNAKAYLYAVDAYNDYGISPRTAVSEAGC